MLQGSFIRTMVRGDLRDRNRLAFSAPILARNGAQCGWDRAITKLDQARSGFDELQAIDFQAFVPMLRASTRSYQ
jgi:hypothetical protein